MPMTMPTPSEECLGRFEQMGASMVGQGVMSGKMFGMPIHKARGKAFAGLWGDAMVFKLIGEDHAAALALEGAEPFDPSGTGRAMKEWVVVPADHGESWPDLRGCSVGRRTGLTERPNPRAARSANEGDERR